MARVSRAEQLQSGKSVKDRGRVGIDTKPRSVPGQLRQKFPDMDEEMFLTMMKSLRAERTAGEVPTLEGATVWWPWPQWREWLAMVTGYFNQALYDVVVENNTVDHLNVLISYIRPDGTIQIMDTLQAPSTQWTYTLEILCKDVTLYAVRFVPVYLESGGWHYYDDGNGGRYYVGTGDVTKNLSDGMLCQDVYTLNDI